MTAAQDINQLAPLDFGTLAITSNTSVSTLEFPRSGRNLSITGNLILVEKGEPGRYRLTGFPPNTGIDIEIDQASMTAGGTGIPEILIVDSYDTGTVRTNDLGEAEFQLGASFSTSGNGGDYEDAPYLGDAQLRMHYWEPSVGEYVTVSETVNFVGEVRSSFALEEASSMHFGTLFARGEPGNQASFRLFPDGRRDIVNAGEAKILSLSPPRPAVLMVSGAAPNRELTIETGPTEVEMKHKDNPTGPHFVLTDLETSPDGKGRTNDAGELEIGVGATLKTQGDLTSSVVYPAGTYEATYSVTVSY
ncbi:MAG: DUF4402 domain-containing protein [Alteromonadaceae bacterium]|nr:DUF4402 domain-containing protein [Alteromonadaceae bacterium]